MHGRFPLPLALAALAFAAASPLALALDWKTKVFEATTKPFQATVEASFEFRNTGASTVRFLSVDSTCDCVTASSERTTFAPGETGRVAATFTVGDRVGEYERIVYVTTDEPVADPVVRLLLRIAVPDIVDISPRLVYWRTGGPPTEQTVEIKIVAAVDLHLDDVQTMTQSFTARLETVTPGKLYRLHVKPNGTAEPISDALRVRGATADGRPLVFSAYTYVK